MTPHSVIYLIVLGLVQAAALPSRNSISLYSANDKLSVLVGQNFSSTVYQSKTAWVVEFYASWCGHCQNYAKKYREIGIDTWGWRTVVRIGAINCYADENNPICDQHGVRGYPTIRLIEPQSTLNTSKVIVIAAADPKLVEKDLINQLEALQYKDERWPHFAPMTYATLNDLYAQISPTVKLVLVIVEQRDDPAGRQVMLDFSRYYEQLVIFRTTPNATLWIRLKMNITDLPAVFAIFSNQTVERLALPANTSNNIGSRNGLNYAIRTYIHQWQLIENFDDHDLEEIMLSKNALNMIDSKKQSNQVKSKPVENINIDQQRLNMLDLEAALSYMLRREVPRIKEIQGETYDALVHWLLVLTKYFPGREPVMFYLKRLLSRVNEQSNGLTGNQFRALADINTSIGYLPSNHIDYKFCAGSSSQYRGYPCAVWVLFHTLTVAQVQSQSEIMSMMEIPSAVKNFIKYFFGCRHCSENFMKETSDIHELDSKTRYGAVLYLWKVHNHINQRLSKDITEDPQHPKVQFPSAQQCPNCRTTTKTDSPDEFDQANTVDFLLRFYAKSNIDQSTVIILNITADQKSEIAPRREHQASLDRYSMLELNHPSSSGHNGFFSSLFRRPSTYVFLAVVITVGFARRRYCKSKRKRYTL